MCNSEARYTYITFFSELLRNQNGVINLKVYFHIKENRLRSFPDTDRSNEAIYFHDRTDLRSQTGDGLRVRELKKEIMIVLILSNDKIKIAGSILL